MSYYLIICRSLTYAQRTASALEKAGISAYMRRTPISISRTGCGHSVLIQGRYITRAMEIISRTGLTHLGVYTTDDDGVYQEVSL